MFLDVDDPQEASNLSLAVADNDAPVGMGRMDTEGVLEDLNVRDNQSLALDIGGHGLVDIERLDVSEMMEEGFV